MTTNKIKEAPLTNVARNDQGNWYVYIVQCVDQTFYTGITTDYTRRVHEHNYSNVAAKYTRVRRPVTLVYKETVDDRSQALKREIEIKRLSKPQKARLISLAAEQDQVS
ncbi:MAG: GIY-YIG nuclease family protein [Pseudomonadota bacterium]